MIPIRDKTNTDVKMSFGGIANVEKDDNFECGYFEASISKASGCPRQG